jgi:hypothetical protein
VKSLEPHFLNIFSHLLTPGGFLAPFSPKYCFTHLCKRKIFAIVLTTQWERILQLEYLPFNFNGGLSKKKKIHFVRLPNFPLPSTFLFLLFFHFGFLFFLVNFLFK